MGLAIGGMQIQKRARQGGCIGRGQAQIGQRWGWTAEHRVGHSFAHVAHKAGFVAGL